MKRVLASMASLSALLLTITSCGPLEEPAGLEISVSALPPSPLDRRQDHSLVWSGEEVLVWGGHDSNQHEPFPDGAAYSPKTDSWRLLPENDLEPRTRHSTVMVGEQMLVWGGFTPTHSGAPDGHLARDGALYNPVSDSWEPIAQAPQGRASARGVATEEHVVFTGGNSARNGDVFLVYSVQEDTWHTIPFESANEALTVYDLTFANGRVVAVGASSTGVSLASFGPDDGSTSFREPPELLEVAPEHVFVGLAPSPAHEALLALRDLEGVGLYEIGPDGHPELLDELDHAAFRPPVRALTHPLMAGEMDTVEGLGLLATGPGEFSVWNPETGRSHRLQQQSLSDYCGPLVPVGDGTMIGWGGLGCETTGIRADIEP